MGMYDRVKAPTLPCKKCGERLSDWQSKDADCECEEVGMGEVDCFYDWCDNCKTMNTYRRKHNPRPDNFEDFELEE